VSIGIRDDDGTAFFHTYSSGDLGKVNNLLVISRSNKAGNSMTVLGMEMEV